MATGVVQGCKFYDANGNGAWDANESALPHWTINFTGPQSGQVTTGTDGCYSISALLPGVYTVCEVMPLGWTQTYPPGGCHVVKIGTGQTISGLHFGNYLTLSTGANPSGRYVLHASQPNPFTSAAMIGFELPRRSRVTLKVFDMLGREVATLAERSEFIAGTHQLMFNGHGLKSGVYLSRIVVETPDGSAVLYSDAKKLLLVR